MADPSDPWDTLTPIGATPPPSVPSGGLTPPAPSVSADPWESLTPLPKTTPPETFGPPQEPWKSSLWPLSTDETGKVKFPDPSAGIIGKAIDAFALPGNINTGQQQIYDPGTGTFDPSFVDRNLNFATLASPMPAAVRAEGQLFPGVVGGQSELTGKQLKTAADAGFDAARASTTTIPSSAVASYSTALQQRLLTEHGLLPQTAPETFKALEGLTKPASAETNYITLDATRSQLSAIAKNAMGNRDAFAAQKAIKHIDNLIDTIGPESGMAYGNLAAAKRADVLTGELTQANTGILERADTAAQLRRRVSTLTQSEDKMRGFTPGEIESLDKFAKSGGALPMGLSKVGDVLGSGFGKLVSGGAGAFFGASHGGPEGGVAGFFAGPYLGEGLKSWEAARASAQLEAIAQQLRSRSPLGESLGPQNIRTWPPSLNRAIPSLLAPTPMAPQPQPGQFPPMQPVNPNEPGPPRPTGDYFHPYGGTAPSRFPFGTPLPPGLLDPWA
jgi:hypothetical protein